MFKKFTAVENISTQSQVKASVARGIRNTILQQYPVLEGVIEEILPKKTPTFIAKWCVF
jgi:PUA domain protein